MIIAIRHGSTTLNDQDKVRGQLDIPLNPKGAAEMEKTAQHFAGLPIDRILASGMQRSQQSAQILSKAIGGKAQVVPMAALNPWNMGSLQGHSVGAEKSKINYFYDHPNEPTPGGESYQQFLSRFLPVVLPLIHDNQPHVMVSHNRNMHALEALAAAKGKGVDVGLLKRDPEGQTKPGHVMVLDHTYEPKFLSPEGGSLAESTDSALH